MRLFRLTRVGAIACLAVVAARAGHGLHAQDFLVQPDLTIQSLPLDTIAQSYDGPLPGGRSPRNANYQIEATLDHENRTITARETITWRNISQLPAEELRFHLYWNAWRNSDSTWLRERALAGGSVSAEDDEWGFQNVSSIRVRRVPTAALPEGIERDPLEVIEAPGDYTDLTDALRYLAPDDGNTADHTVMAVPLSDLVLPNQTVEIEIAWTARVPRTFARTGYEGNHYLIAHWFPQIGVLEDSGWNAHQFHSATEFYADYGEYDVQLTVPGGWVLGASGERVGLDTNADGTATHRYRGEDIHGFAWTTSPDFVEFEQPFEHPTLPNVQMRLLLQPEHMGQETRHFDAAATALRLYGEWFGAYPYDHLTIVDPAWRSGTGGMEYPTLFTAGTRWLITPRELSPEAVTIHEVGHQFFYAIVGTNEFEHAWMDEGFNQFAQSRAQAEAYPDRVNVRRYFGGFLPYQFDDAPWTRMYENGMAGYLANAEADVPATPTFRYWPGNSHASITYSKTALALHTLEGYLGWDTVRNILSTYYERWQFRHPKPDDFFAIVNEVSGQDMTWFFDQVYRGSNEFDYGLRRLTSAVDRAGGYFDSDDGLVVGERASEGMFLTTVVAERYGEATFPVDVVTTFANGSTARERWDGLARRVVYSYDRDSRAVSAEVDPGQVLRLDVRRTNNSITTEPMGEAVSLKWALKWLVWMQDMLLTYGFFV